MHYFKERSTWGFCIKRSQSRRSMHSLCGNRTGRSGIKIRRGRRWRRRGQKGQKRRQEQQRFEVVISGLMRCVLGHPLFPFIVSPRFDRLFICNLPVRNPPTQLTNLPRPISKTFNSPTPTLPTKKKQMKTSIPSSRNANAAPRNKIISGARRANR